MAQLACRGEATILDRDNDSLFGIEGRANLPSVRIAEPRARRAAWYEAAIQEPGEAKRAARWVSAHHGEMIGEGALGLAPYRALAGDVRRAASFRDDALQAHVAGVPPDLRPVALDTFGELNPRRSLAHHVLKDGAAVLKLAPAHVFTVEMKKVEGDEKGTRGALAGECGMEREEV